MISDFDLLVSVIFQYFRTNKTTLIDNIYLSYLIGIGYDSFNWREEK